MLIAIRQATPRRPLLTLQRSDQSAFHHAFNEGTPQIARSCQKKQRQPGVTSPCPKALQSRPWLARVCFKNARNRGCLAAELWKIKWDIDSKWASLRATTANLQGCCLSVIAANHWAASYLGFAIVSSRLSALNICEFHGPWPQSCGTECSDIDQMNQWTNQFWKYKKSRNHITEHLDLYGIQRSREIVLGRKATLVLGTAVKLDDTTGLWNGFPVSPSLCSSHRPPHVSWPLSPNSSAGGPSFRIFLGPQSAYLLSFDA